jgi:spore photoproduct lyase
VVVFVNIEDIFEEVKNMLKEHSVYLCTSYDTDMTAFESLTHYTKEWINFASNVYDNKLLIEIRTKCANENVWKENKANENVIVAFTISPDETIQLYEHKTPSLDSRLKCINTAIDNGYKVRLCFDPIIYCKEFEKKYKEFTDYVFSKVNADKIYDCSAGSFRISKEYMKIMRKNNESSVVINYPYENIDGYYQYPKEIQEKIKDISLNSIGKYLPKDKINFMEDV